MLMFSSLLLAASLPPAAAPLSGEALIAQTRPIVGGYRAADVNGADVRAAAAFAAQSVDGELAEITSAQRQTVAGVNYQISFTTTDGRSYDAIVFHGLDRSYRVTSIDETGDTGSNEAAEEETSESDEE